MARFPMDNSGKEGKNPGLRKCHDLKAGLNSHLNHAEIEYIDHKILKPWFSKHIHKSQRKPHSIASKNILVGVDKFASVDFEFEREFLRYFRITQAFFMEPQVQVDLLLATAGEKVRKVFYQLGLSAEDSKDL